MWEFPAWPYYRTVLSKTVNTLKYRTNKLLFSDYWIIAVTDCYAIFMILLVYVGLSKRVTVLLWAVELLNVKCLFLTFLVLISVLATAVPLSPASTFVHCVNVFSVSCLLLAIWCLHIKWNGVENRWTAPKCKRRLNERPTMRSRYCSVISNYR